MKKTALILALLSILLAARAGMVLAQGGYALSWWSVSGGGGASSGGTFTVSGAAGQPNAGTLTGGGYSLSGGFWGIGAVASGFNIYLPLITKSG